MMPRQPPGLRVILTFDLLVQKVDHFDPCSEVGSFVFKISCSQDCEQMNGREDGRTDEQTVSQSVERLTGHGS